MVNFPETIITELGALRGMQEFESTTDPSSALAQNYTFKLTLNGSSFNSGNDITVALGASDSLTDIATKLAAAINAITASSVTAAKDSTSGKIRVKSVLSTELTSQISFSAPTAGSSLLTLLGGVGPAMKKPQLVKYNVNNSNKTTTTYGLPAVVVSSLGELNPFHCVGSSSRVKTMDFNVRIQVPAQTTKTLTQEYSDALQSECERIINAASVSGGFWSVNNTYFEAGDLIDVPNISARQTILITTPGRA